jgi:enoyl-CoA hydratase/carnithine racemase
MASMRDYEARHFLWEVSGKVATITLNRPERKNPLTFDSYAELRDVFQSLHEDQEVRSVVITGAGGNFCSGGDVFEIIEPLTRKDMAGLREFTTMTGAVVKAMRHCPQPVIAAVDGICAGAGAILAMASDMRIGTPRARTAFLFVRVGLAGCDMGACAILPRIIGHGRASELLYTGRFMEADEAERWGFFNRLVEPGQVLEEARTTAKVLSDGPTFGHAVTKRQLHEEWDMSIDDAIDAEAEAQAVCMKTRDFQRAFEAFAAKQRPVFEGN